MTYKTILIEMAVGESNSNLLKVAGDLATRFKASVIGVAACQPLELVCATGYYAGDVIQDDRDELQRELDEAEAEFRAVFSTDNVNGALTPAGWHSAVTYGALADYVGSFACEADVILTAGGGRTFPGASRCADTGDLLMLAGRPVLLLPRGNVNFSLERVLVAWKNTRETRRAISDALPLLQLAKHVVLAQFVPVEEIKEYRETLEGVTRWLQSYDVPVQCLTLPTTGEDPTALKALIEEQQSDLVVAGAYGHTRMREWVLGGVTRDLLLHESHCSLLSH
jgi:nucleotide-binding universal stress UspA family protein